MDLGAGECLEARDAELLGKGVDARVLEQLVTRVVDRGERVVGFEDPLAWEFLGEVLGCVEVFEE